MNKCVVVQGGFQVEFQGSYEKHNQSVPLVTLVVSAINNKSASLCFVVSVCVLLSGNSKKTLSSGLNVWMPPCEIVLLLMVMFFTT